MLLRKKIPLSYIFKMACSELCNVLIIGLAVCYLTSVFGHSIPGMPLGIPAFLGAAILVILSFKLNQSYEVWWEARKIWGSIVNDSRSFVLQFQSFISGSNSSEFKTISFRHIAWCYSLSNTIRGKDVSVNLEVHLGEEDLVSIKQHGNRHLAILQLNTLHIARLRDDAKLNVFTHVQLNNPLVNFSNSMGMAERIKSTVFPVDYDYFLHSTIYIFVATLSISLRDIESYFEIPLLLVISAAFPLLDKTATHLENPFSDLQTDTAMTAVCNTKEINIRRLIAETEVPATLQAGSSYI